MAKKSKTKAVSHAMGINNPIPRSLKSETKYVLYGFGWETFKKVLP